MPTLSWPKTDAETVPERRTGSHRLPVGRLDLDDLGAHVGQHPGAMRTGDGGRKIEDAKALKALCRIVRGISPFCHSGTPCDSCIRWARMTLECRGLRLGSDYRHAGDWRPCPASDIFFAVQRNWNRSCIVSVKAGTRAFLESTCSLPRKWTTSSGWAASQPFRRPCPGPCGAGATSGFCCRDTGTSSNNSPTSKSSANAPALAEMPACSLGLASTKDGLPVYVLLCPQLYDRPGNPYGDTAGRDWPDNDVRFGRFASAAAQLAAGTLDKNWAADLVHANDWQAALVPAYLAWNAVRIPTILTIHNLAYQGLFPEGIAAPDRRAGTFLSYRRPRILRQTVLPQGRHRLRFASDHRQRDLCQGDHHARTRLRARGSASPPLRRRSN